MTPEQVARSIPAGSRVILTALVAATGDEDRPVIAALESAIAAWGALHVATVLQRRENTPTRRRSPGGAKQFGGAVHHATFIGEGKVRELAAAIAAHAADCVLFGNVLAPRHRRNLEAALGVPVLPYRPGSQAPGDIETLWVDAWNDLALIVGETEEEQRGALCLLPDGSVVDVAECENWLRRSVYEGWRVRVMEGWVNGRRGAVATRWQDMAQETA